MDGYAASILTDRINWIQFFLLLLLRASDVCHSFVYTILNRVTAPQYVASRLVGLKDDDSSRLRIAHLLYLRAMIAFAKAPALLGNTNTEDVSVHVINAPEVVAHHLLANFCQKSIKGEGNSNYIRTNSLRDKLYVHALCLALILEPDYKLKLDTISGDLGLPTQRTQQLIKELGCKVKGGDTAVLTVPLVFPTRRKINKIRDRRKT